MPSREPTAEKPWTSDERDAVVDRIRARNVLPDVEKLRWHALFHAVSGQLISPDSRSCEFCRLDELGT